MTSASPSPVFQHPRWGLCELIRIEGTNWVIRVKSSGVTLRIPSELRSAFQAVTSGVIVSAVPPLPAAAQKPFDPRRKARRVLESLRVGLPSLDGTNRHLAVGFEHMTSRLKTWLT